MNCPNTVNILVPRSARTSEPESVRRSRATVKAVAEVRQVRVDAVAPGVAEGLYLLRLARDVGSGCRRFTSRLVVDHWKLELNLMPYGGSM